MSHRTHSFTSHGGRSRVVRFSHLRRKGGGERRESDDTSQYPTHREESGAESFRYSVAVADCRHGDEAPPETFEPTNQKGARELLVRPRFTDPTDETGECGEHQTDQDDRPHAQTGTDELRGQRNLCQINPNQIKIIIV